MNSYSCLDLDIIKQKVASLACINEAKDFICEEEVPFNPLQIKNNLVQTKEALNILKDNNVINFDGIENINDLLEKADKGITLSGNELLRILVFHNHCYRLKSLFTKFNKELSIRDYTDSINVDIQTFEKIENCIDHTGEVKEDATIELKNIYKDLQQADKDLYNRAHQFIDKHTSSLQEPTIFERNGRITFLIKNSDKNKYGGYTYGASASGLACYVEPNIFIELNNHKLSLLEARDKEINRILQHLTYLIASVSEYYIHNFESLKMLNVIFAKATYGFDHNGILADICDGYYFDIKDLCHPLIDENKVVSNSYRLFEPYQGIVISGSNTGGKTVSLKAIGLSVLMSYLGIPIIASKANIPLYRNVYVDIDDNQSIEDSLSTFSAHITNINSILSKAKDDSLILIDELISGTDPKEAQAISLAIMEKIQRIGSTFIITTHFDDIKNYAYKDERILLSSVGFNMETLTPNYRYIEDSIGSSNAIEIASRYFDDTNIINRAKYYLSENRSKEDELIEKLSRQISENEILKDELNNETNKYNQLVDEYNKKIIDFENEKELLKNRYIEELNEYINEIKEKAQIKLDSIKEVSNSNIVKQINELKIDSLEQEEKEIKLNIGDNVRIKDNEQIGTITDIKNDIISINVRGITVKTNKNKLTLMPKIKAHKVYVERKHYSRVPAEINLVGERVEDAIIRLEPYLDSALLANMSSVKIIHGYGTGALRSAIRENLKKKKFIKNIKDGDYYDGGSAVTIVEFK